MADSYYPEDEAPAEPTGGEDTSSKPEDKAEGETFLVPKSAIGDKDKQPGDTCEFKLVRVYDDEYEFEYVKHSEEEKESPMAGADAMVDAMAAGDEEG